MQKIQALVNKRYKLEGVYETYIKHIRGIHHDMINGIQIVYVIKGKVKLGKNIFVQGDIFLINNSQPKFIYNCELGSYIGVLNIHSDFIKDRLKDDDRFLYKNDLTDLSQSDSIKSLMLSIYKLALDDSKDDSIKSNIDKIIYILNKKYTYIDRKVSYSSTHMEYLIDIKDYIKNNDPVNFNLDNISKKIYISPSYASTIFKNVTGISFSEFLQQYLLYLSTIKLIEGNDNIEDISSKVGFRSSKSLNLIFNRYLSITPSKFRSTYQNMKEESDYVEAFNLLTKLDLDRYEEIYKKQELNFHKIELSNNLYNKNRLNLTLEVKNFGHDYIENIGRVLKTIKLEEIVIPIELKEKDMILSQLNIKIDFKDLRDLLNIMSINNITPTFKIKLDKIEFIGKSYCEIQEKMKENIKKLNKFYSLISDIVGVSKMKEYKYFIEVGVLNNYIYNKKDLFLYRKYLIEKQRLLEKLLGTKDYKWGYDIGTISVDKVKSLIKIYKNFKPSKFKPRYLSIDCNIDDLTVINTVDDGMVVIDKIKEKIGLIENSLKFINNKFEKIYIQDLFKSLDVTNLPDDYKDLFTIMLINEARYLSGSKYEYSPDYIMLDSKSRDGYYYPKLINDYGFYTPIYWACSLINQFKGELIYWGHNILARRDDEDLYVLILGSAIIDIIFSKAHNFRNLESYSNKVKFKLEGIEGRYKKTEQTLEYRRGSAEYYLKDYKNYRYLSYDEIRKIEKISSPKFNVEIINLDGQLETEIKHTPFTMILQIYKRIS